MRPKIPPREKTQEQQKNWTFTPHASGSPPRHLHQNSAGAGEGGQRLIMPPERLKRAYGVLAARIPAPLSARRKAPPKQIPTTASPTPVPPEPQSTVAGASSESGHGETATASDDEGALARTRSTQSDAPHEYPAGLKLGLILTALMTSMFLVALVCTTSSRKKKAGGVTIGCVSGKSISAILLTSPCQDRLIIATAIPQITDDFGSVTDIGWYGSAYLLATCAFQLMFGKLYTFWSIKVVFLTSVLLFEIGSAVCGAAPSSIAFIIGRAIAGIGAAGIFSGAVCTRPFLGLIASVHRLTPSLVDCHPCLRGSAPQATHAPGPLRRHLRHRLRRRPSSGWRLHHGRDVAVVLLHQPAPGRRSHGHHHPPARHPPPRQCSRCVGEAEAAGFSRNRRLHSRHRVLAPRPPVGRP